MGRTLKQVDDALADLEASSKETYKQFRESLSGMSRSVSLISSTQNALSTTVNGISSTQNGISKTVNGISITQSGLSKTVNGISITQNDVSVTVNRLSKTVNDYSLTLSKASGTASYASVTATGVAASLTALTIGISLFKVDEKGITILGATREFKWTNKWIDKWQRIFESKKQKEARRDKDHDAAILENLRRDMDRIKRDHPPALDGLRRDVDRIKDAFRTAGRSMQDQRTAEANRPGRSPRNVDTTHTLGPTVRGVASDVRILRSAVDELARSFA
ncbi:hypothetical protein ACFPM3_30200 [Streptomyces coeruleoprunus]|uniref:Uncharacterized protein n=1 Tax=Streptomyces coeruleoprunus TaxID=285563 RepID=A0ABV9XM09_9ACTN